MIELKDYINEGILDDIDDNIASGDDVMYSEQLTKWGAAAKNSAKPSWRKTKRGYVLKGNFMIDDIDDVYTGPVIKNLTGNLAIRDTKLENLEGIFDIECTITGSFTVEDNNELVSLKGCPLEVGTLTVANNKKLKDIDVSPVVMNNAYIAYNGKKFKKEDLEKTMQVAKRIFCSVEPSEDTVVLESQTINEAFKAPQLALVADAIKKACKAVKSREDVAHMNNIRSIRWDAIRASDITEYDSKEAESAKAIRKVLANRDGIIILLNKAGEVTHIITGKSGVTYLGNYNENRPYSKYVSGVCRYTYQTSEILDLAYKHSDVVWVIDTSEAGDGWSTGKKGRLSVHDQQIARTNSRKNAIAYQRSLEKEYTTAEIEKTKGVLVRYNNDVVKENRARYKRLIAEERAKKELANNNRFAAINDRVDKCFTRYMKLIRAVSANPTKYSDSRHEIAKLHVNFTSNGSSYSYSASNYGLMKALEEYLKILADKDKYIGDNRSEFDKMYHNPAAFTKALHELEVSMENRLNYIENSLKELESIR